MNGRILFIVVMAVILPFFIYDKSCAEASRFLDDSDIGKIVEAPQCSEENKLYKIIGISTKRWGCEKGKGKCIPDEITSDNAVEKLPACIPVGGRIYSFLSDVQYEKLENDRYDYRVSWQQVDLKEYEGVCNRKDDDKDGVCNFCDKHKWEPEPYDCIDMEAYDESGKVAAWIIDPECKGDAEKYEHYGREKKNGEQWYYEIVPKDSPKKRIPPKNCVPRNEKCECAYKHADSGPGMLTPDDSYPKLEELFQGTGGGSGGGTGGGADQIGRASCRERV